MKQLIIYLLFLIPVSISHSAILHVSKSGFAPYTEVQPAIDAASPGDTILIAPSAATYQGFTVDRQVSIIGAGSDDSPGGSTKIGGPVSFENSSDYATICSIWISASAGSNVDSMSAVLRIRSEAHDIFVSECYIENLYNDYYGNSSKAVWVGNEVTSVIAECAIVATNSRSGSTVLSTGSGTNLIIEGCVLRGGTSYSCYPLSGYFTARHCVFLYTGSNGAIAYSSTATGSIENCASVPYRLLSNLAENFAVNYCASRVAIPSGNGNVLTSDNEFVSFSTNPRIADLHVGASSPLFDAGNPIAPPDLDGSRADIGIYGGQTPYDEFGIPDYPFVIELEIPASVPQNGVLHIGSTGRVGNGGGQ